MTRFHSWPLFAGLVSLPLFSFLAFAEDPSPEALIKAGHWKRARALVEQRDPADHEGSNNAQAAYLLSQVKTAFGELESALQLAETAVSLDGGNASYHFQLAVVCGETAEKASLFSKAIWARRFKEEAEKAAALDSKNLDARFALIEYYLQAPRLMGGSVEKARAMANEIGKIDLAQGYMAQARLAQGEKDATKEEGFYLKALAASPRDYGILVSLANFYALDSQRKFDEVEKFARQALEIEAGRVEAYSSLAYLYAFQQRRTELDLILGKAEKNVSDDFSPYFRAGRALLDQGKDLPRAERYFRKYLTQVPEADAPALAEAHWRLGLALEKQGRMKEAVSEIEAALRMKPNLTEAKKDLERLK